MLPEIVVMGATSVVGQELISRLLHTGVTPCIAVRNQEKAERLFNHQPLMYRPVDFTNDTSIEEALKNSRIIFLIPPATSQMAAYVKNIVKAARKKRIDHIVFLSIIGASIEASGAFGRWYGDAEMVIKKSEIPYTILRSNCLMQNLVKYLQLQSSMIALPFSGGAVSFIDARDVAIVGADILLPGAHYQEETFELTGPAAITLFEVAEILSMVLGKQIGYVSVSVDTAAYGLEGKISESQIDAVLEYFRFLGQGGGAIVTDSVEKIGGIRPVTFIDFVRDYAQKIRYLTTW
ncbi:MAG: NAD(P)H-binding protein [Fibrobacter sp.]|nr:NAD(P)H-binding protein [Fibrobacter sp.]